MKKILLLLFSLLAALPAFAMPSRPEALAAIATLETSVMSDGARAAAATITQYVAESDDVMITLDPETLVWLGDHDGGSNDEGVRAMLTAAYVAGDAKSQLESGRPVDDPYSGWKAVIRAYRELKGKTGFKSPAIERLIVLETEGKLKAHAREVQEKLQQAAPAPANPHYF